MENYPNPTGKIRWQFHAPDDIEKAEEAYDPTPSTKMRSEFNFTQPHLFLGIEDGVHYTIHFSQEFNNWLVVGTPKERVPAAFECGPHQQVDKLGDVWIDVFDIPTELLTS